MMRKLISLTILPMLLWACESSKPMEVTLLQGPSLPHALADSATMRWLTDAGTNSQVAYRKMIEEDWQFALGKTRMLRAGLVENEVVLKELIPGVLYEYRIFTGDQELASDSLLFCPDTLTSGKSRKNTKTQGNL